MVDYSHAGVAQIEGLYSQFAQGCADRMGTDVPRQCRHRVVRARHGRRARRARREPDQLSGLLLRNRTGRGIRRALRATGSGRWFSTEPSTPRSIRSPTTIRQMAGFQTAFNDYAADCAQSPGCPLGTDPAKFVDRFHQLVDPLVQTPGRTSDPRGLSYQDAMTGTVNALYTRRYWKYLTSGLLGLARGTDAGDLLLLADDYQDRDESGHYANLQDAFTAIRCVDSPYPTDPAVWADADPANRATARRSCPTATSPASRRATRARCGRFRRRRLRIQAASPGPGKVVVVSTTHDPATPYQAGVDLAHRDGRRTDHLRGHPTHRRVQRRSVRRHRGGELPHRLRHRHPTVCGARPEHAP